MKYLGVVCENGKEIEFFDVPQKKLQQLQSMIDKKEYRLKDGALVFDIDVAVTDSIERFLEEHP